MQMHKGPFNYSCHQHPSHFPLPKINLLCLAKQSEVANIRLHRGILSIEIHKGGLLVQQTDLVALAIPDDAEDTSTVGGRLDASRDDPAALLESRAGEFVQEGDCVAVGDDGATDLGAGDVVGNGEIEGGERLAGLPGGSGQGSGEEGGDGDEGVHFRWRFGDFLED